MTAPRFDIKTLIGPAFGGLIGGFTWGLISGLMDSAGFDASFGIGLRTMFSGMLAALIGYVMLVSFGRPGAFWVIVSTTVIGIVFFTSNHILAPSPYEEMVAGGSLLISAIGGAIGGAGGGVAVVVLRNVLPQRSGASR